MKKSRKHLKDLARLTSYLKKEGARLEKLISRSASSEASPLVADVLHRLSARHDVALTDLGLVSAAEAAARTSAKAEKSAPKASKKPAKKPAKKAGKAPAAKKATKPRKAAAKKTAPVKAVRTPKPKPKPKPKAVPAT